MTLHRDELCVAITGLVLTLDELEFADMVVVAESAEEQAAIAESVFAARGLQSSRRPQNVNLDEQVQSGVAFPHLQRRPHAGEKP